MGPNNAPGCFYFTTGVMVKDIRVEDNGIVNIGSYTADKIVLSNDKGLVLEEKHGLSSSSTSDKKNTIAQ